MSRLAVNPTRMELRRLKARLKTAERGHKLLKDKSDEMIRRFLSYIRENKRLREEIETELAEAMRCFMFTSATVSREELRQTLSMPPVSATVSASLQNVMGVEVPIVTVTSESVGELPYSTLSATSDLDVAVEKINALMGKLLKLAEVEKTCNMLADEIERNRRRVNALEYVMIPQLNETIKYIMMKLDENERGALVRLMKVKTLINHD